MGEKIERPTKGQPHRPKSALVFYAVVVLVLIIGGIFVASFYGSLLVLVSVVFILATIRIQIRRYRKAPSRNNLYPLLGYVFLFFGGLAMMLYRLPQTDIVFLRRMSLDYSAAWQSSLFFVFLGFLFLAMWAWDFIRVRPFLRTYVIFLSVAIIVSALGSLIFTVLIFNIVEKNNLQIMTHGAQTQQLIQLDRSNTALFVAQTVAEDDDFIEAMVVGNVAAMLDQSTKFLESAGLDTLRVYNKFGEVVASPSDPRDKGRLFTDDPLVAFALNDSQHVKSFDTAPGVMNDVIVTRAVHPLISDGAVVGAVETGYIFDNAFVDFSKEKTGLDVTVYTGDIRSATTIQTLNNVSRWVGSIETEDNVREKVLTDGESISMVVERLGRIYYSAFEPIRNINGEIIGMVAVGTPTNFLFEDTRQQLLSTFLILTIISIIVAMMGYLAMNSFRNVNEENTSEYV